MKINNSNKQDIPIIYDKDLLESWRYSMFICTSVMFNKLLQKHQNSEVENRNDNSL